MKVVKKIFKIILIIILLILLLLLIAYVKINIKYQKNKDKYFSTYKIVIETGYAPQGLTYSEKYNAIIQSSYSYKDKESKIYVIDFNTKRLLNEFTLEKNKYHVGGLTTNEDTLYITNDYYLYTYDLKEIMNTGLNSIKETSKTKIKNRGDFCLYHDNVLWIGDFALWPLYRVPKNKPLILGYKDGNTKYNKPDYSYEIPKMVQGMAIVDDEFIFTKSYSPWLESELVTYKLKKGKLQKTKSINLPPMAEGMFYKDNHLYILYESNSYKYWMAIPKIKNLVRLEYKKK